MTERPIVQRFVSRREIFDGAERWEDERGRAVVGRIGIIGSSSGGGGGGMCVLSTQRRINRGDATVSV